jgi:hypothetical protein
MFYSLEDLLQSQEIEQALAITLFIDYKNAFDNNA